MKGRIIVPLATIVLLVGAIFIAGCNESACDPCGKNPCDPCAKNACEPKCNPCDAPKCDPCAKAWGPCLQSDPMAYSAGTARKVRASQVGTRQLMNCDCCPKPKCDPCAAKCPEPEPCPTISCEKPSCPTQTCPASKCGAKSGCGFGASGCPLN